MLTHPHGVRPKEGPIQMLRSGISCAGTHNPEENDIPILPHGKTQEKGNVVKKTRRRKQRLRSFRMKKSYVAHEFVNCCFRTASDAIQNRK
mmetsp:Transcript_21919/g.45047  ORF Transcript_21919/g.45047 Transcript_21919/m.45047 type:complete len:91 (-) Transcript_21919:46-318(-)